MRNEITLFMKFNFSEESLEGKIFCNFNSNPNAEKYSYFFKK